MSDSTHTEQVGPSPRRRSWFLRLVVAVAAGVVVATVTWAFLPKPGPTVRTYLRVPLPTPFFARGGEPLPDLSSYQRNQIALCKSRLVLGSALRDPKVKDLSVLAELIEPIAWLEKEVQVDFSLAPEIMRIAMTGMEPNDLVVLVNAIREAYQREVVDREISVRKQRQEFLAGLIQKHDEQLKAARQTQKDAAEMGNPRNASGREMVLAFIQQQLGMIEKELLTTQAALRKAQLSLRLRKVRQEKIDQLKPVDQDTLDETLAKDPEVQTVKEEIRQKETLVARARQISEKGDNDPSVVRLRGEISELTGKMSVIGERLRPKVMQQLKDRARRDLQSQITTLETQIDNLKETETILGPEIERLRARVVQLGKQGLKLDMFQEDISHLESMTRRLKNEHEALKVELMAPSQVSVIEEATVIGVNEPWRPFVPVLAGLGGFLFAFSCMAVRVRVSLR